MGDTSSISTCPQSAVHPTDRSSFSHLLSSVSFVQDVHAEAPADDDESKEGGDDEANDEDGGDDKEEEGEPVDPKPQLEEDCAKSAQCSGYKHHYDECVERVTSAEENPDHKGPKEDCVEEYFHLQHCATQCAAVKLFKQLK